MFFKNYSEYCSIKYFEKVISKYLEYLKRIIYIIISQYIILLSHYILFNILLKYYFSNKMFVRNDDILHCTF